MRRNRSITALAMIGVVCLTPIGGSAQAQSSADSPAPGRGREQKGAPFAMVTGTVAYLQRIALPPDANLRVRLEDVSRQDAAARLISEVTLPTAGKQVPLAFAIPYRPADILAQHRYHVRATIFVKDKMWFTTTMAYPVITGGAPSDVALVVQSAASPVLPPAGAPSSTSFKNTVWEVRTSRQVSPGQLYVFLSEGTLVVASRNGKPALGSWTYKDGVLTMTEEGRSYKVDIVKLGPGELRIRMRNPGSPVEMTLVPARGALGLRPE